MSVCPNYVGLSVHFIKDSHFRLLWKDLTRSEKQQHTNRLKTSVINYYMVEESPIKHYSKRRDELLTDDYEKYLEFPSEDIYKMIEKFNPAQLYRDVSFKFTKLCEFSV